MVENQSESTNWESNIRTRALLCDLNQQKSLQLPDITSLAHPKTQEDIAVIIVENINLDWISTLGTALDIDAAFFCEHALSPGGNSPWKAVFSSSPAGHKKPTQSVHTVNDADIHSHEGTESNKFTSVSWHVDGVFDLGQSDQDPPPLRTPSFIHRRLDFVAHYGWQATTRISCYRVNEKICQ